jgi:hypothetical protein
LSSQTLARLLDRLEELKRPSGAEGAQARLSNVLAELNKRKFTDASALIRFHEMLLFMRAYPQSPRLLRQVEAMLKTFPRRVWWLQSMEADLSLFADPEVSGIAGTSLTAIFSYPVARWLVTRHPSEVLIDWEGYEDGARLGETLPRFVPLLEEESLVEANIPYNTWLRAARSRHERELTWLMRRFESLRVSEREKAELYDSLKLYLTWQPRAFSVTRTGMKRKVSEIFYHDRPLLSRREVSLTTEMNAPPLPLKKLSRSEGTKVLNMIRDTSTIRYRELHGFTYGDPARVVRVEAGRGVEFFVCGVGAEHRLPLRTYHAALIVKNGVPIGYTEGISLFERIETGINVYYTFREGESAWLYGRVMRLFRQLLGVTAFSIDPYQIGFENEEGIESGAFWFYRKLGFRPVRSEIDKLVRAEEEKIATRKAYRTNAKTLRQFAVGHMLFEAQPATRGSWDKFQIRNLGLKIQQRMASSFGGDALKMRRASAASVGRALGLKASGWKEAERRAFENLALVLSLIPNLSRWTKDEKQAVTRIIRAKAGAQESRYLRLLQKHEKLRKEIIRLGS